MRRLGIAILLAWLACGTTTRASEIQDMKITAYCPESCPGEITASGDKVRIGIAAVGSEHYGDTALVWTESGRFLGYYECLDKGGTDGIKDGYVIDLWMPNEFRVKRLMMQTEGKCRVQFVEAKG